MRPIRILAAALLLFTLALPLAAATPEELSNDQQKIDILRQKANLATPREQCFLYAELLHQMTEFSLHQYAAGNFEKSSELLHQVQQLAAHIHMSVSNDNKRLKNAEILLNHTAFRLREFLHSSHAEDRTLIAETLSQVDQVQHQTMLAVFQK